jgi:hypothetical protein
MRWPWSKAPEVVPEPPPKELAPLEWAQERSTLEVEGDTAILVSSTPRAAVLMWAHLVSQGWVLVGPFSRDRGYLAGTFTRPSPNTTATT